jgi:surfeit locus 1 family protein
MQIFGFEFRPKIWSTLLTIIIVALFVKLGIWQLHRYHYKKAIQDDFAARVNLAPQPLAVVLDQFQKNSDDFRFRPVIIKGQYDTHQILWDNRIVNSQVGYDVITPLKINDHSAVLVDRGFVPANAMREVIANIDAPTTRIAIEGLLSVPSKNFVLGPEIEAGETKWPVKVMRIDPNLLSQKLGYSLMPYLILLKPNQSNGFVRQWQMPNMMAERSLGYAFQWFAFAVTLLVIYFAMNSRRR